MNKLVGKQKVALVIVAIAIGIIYFLPNIFIPRFFNQANGTNYTWQDMGYYSYEEISFYGVSVRDVIDGYIGGGDPFLLEYKNLPTSWDYYPLSLLIGLFLRLFHADCSLLFVIGDFIFPPISFIIIFFLFFKITKKFLLGIFFSIVFLFFPNLSVFKEALSRNFYSGNFLTSLSDLFLKAFNYNFSRLFVPALTMIFLSAFLLFLYRMTSEKETKRRTWLLCGVLYGALFYVYFYYWVFITIAIAILAFLFFIYRRELFWRLPKIFLCGLVVSIPYWIRFFSLLNNPIYDELKKRIGLLEGRILVWPTAEYLVILSVFLLFGLIFRKYDEDRAVFFYTLSLLLTIPVVKNLQLVFGFNPQPDHWGSRINIYVLVLSILIIISWVLRIFPKKYEISITILLLVMILFLLIIGLTGHIIESRRSIYDNSVFFLDRDMVDSFKWINKNITPGSIFLIGAEISRTALSFYTSMNVYLPHACLTLAPDWEIQERYAEAYKIYGVPTEMVTNSLGISADNNFFYSLDQKKNLSNNFSMFCARYPGAIPHDITENFFQKYQTIEPNIQSLKYHADYVFFGPYERLIGQFDISKYPELELVYSGGSVEIFKITQQVIN